MQKDHFDGLWTPDESWYNPKLMNLSIRPTPPLRADRPLYLFSSHSWGHGHHRDGLHQLLAPEWQKGTDFHDLSVPSAHPVDAASSRSLAEELSDRIAAADVLLVLAGMYGSYSDWMKREVHFAIAHKKPIIPIKPLGQERLSGTAMEFATQGPVAWRGDSIRNAILASVPDSAREDFMAGRARRLWLYLEPSLAVPPKRQRFPSSSGGALRRPPADTIWSLATAPIKRTRF